MGEIQTQVNLYEYKKLRREEKSKKSKPKLTKDEMAMRESIWLYLLNSSGEKFNAYQVYRTFTYLPKPNPREIEENEGAILLLEAQRRFMQYKSPEYTPFINLKHLDLTSAYASSLAGLNESLKFFTSYEIANLDLHLLERTLSGGYFNIIELNFKVPYNNIINLYAPNNRIYYKGKPVSDSNTPNLGDIVLVKAKIMESQKYKIRGIYHFLEDMQRNWLEYDIVKLKVSAYKYIDRRHIYFYKDLNALLTELKHLSKEYRGYAKAALVSFTGMLINIDPGMRVIMLARCEEIIHRLKIALRNSGAQIQGIQIDALYYSEDWDMDLYMEEVMRELVLEFYKTDYDKYPKRTFYKIDVYTPDDYKETAFRLQEIR